MYAKVFQQILDSSIAEVWQTRHVFEDMLKLCDVNGVVDMTREAIARRTNVPLDLVTRAIGELEKPDLHSRNPEHEGRRIVRIDVHRDWGWLICNYEYYRNLVSEEQRRERTKERTRKWRERKSVTHSDAAVTPNDGGDAPVTQGNAGDAMQMNKEMNNKRGDLSPVSKINRISFERELREINKELEKCAPLAEYSEGTKKYARVKQLLDRQAELRTKLGVVA